MTMLEYGDESTPMTEEKWKYLREKLNRQAKQPLPKPPSTIIVPLSLMEHPLARELEEGE